MTAKLTIREFARREGCDEKQVRRAVEKGLLIKDEDGLLTDDQLGSGWRKTNRRGRASTSAAAADNVESVRADVRTMDVRTDAAVMEGETIEEAAMRVALQVAPYPRVEAERIKENYLALIKKLEYEQKAGDLIELRVAEKVFFEASRAARDSWLNWPARVSPLIAADLGLEADSVIEVLTKHVHEHIAQLGEPEADFTDEG